MLKNLTPKYFKNRIKSSPLLFVIMMVFAAFFIGSGIYFAVIGQTRNSTMSFAFTLIIPAFYIIECLMNLKVSVLFATILLVFSSGTVMGACYDVYTHLPVFDTILHGMWGIVFPVMGFAVIFQFLGTPKDNKSFFGYLLFAAMFSIGTALLWELFEYLGYIVGGYDMQEDQIINDFYSYWLSEGHLHLEPVHIEGIAKTILYDAEGNVLLTIDGGYLELGLIDTIIDMALCFICTIAFFGIMTADRFLGKRLYKWLIPAYLKEDKSAEESVEENAPAGEEVATEEVAPAEDPAPAEEPAEEEEIAKV